MKIRLSRCYPLAAALLGLVALSSPSFAVRNRVEKAKVEAFTDRASYAPGSAARLAVRLTIEPGWHVNSNKPPLEYLIPTAVVFEPPAGWAQPEMTYPPGKPFKLEGSEDTLLVYDGTTTFLGSVTVPVAALGEAVLPAVVTYQACDDKGCLAPVEKEIAFELTIGKEGAPRHPEIFSSGSAAPTSTPPAGRVPGRGLAAILLLAVLGGLILNAMPCVLPVLSLKVLGLVRSAGHGKREVRFGALATAGGILVSFWALGVAAIAAKAAGAAVGWGVQFQSPVFVTALAVIVVLFCLNLWGLFEIQLPGRLADVGAAGSREGLGGHFASGLFATLMATPCSAPFLGTALGFALGASAPVIVAVFTAVGIGMALPYFVLAAAPGAAAWLPRPGAWMDTLKGVMGFLLAAAAVWLLYVLSAQVDPVRLAFVELGLLVLSLFVWLRARGVAGPRRVAAGLLATAAIAGTLGLAWTAPSRAPETESGVRPLGLISWIPFDRQQAEALAAEGKLVFVDVTADWCFTCKVNEKAILETPEVAAAFREHEVVAMRADWTNRSDAIADYLASFGRAGIPFYALYRPGSEPHVFSEVLTKQRVLDAVRKAAEQELAQENR